MHSAPRSARSEKPAGPSGRQRARGALHADRRRPSGAAALALRRLLPRPAGADFSTALVRSCLMLVNYNMIVRRPDSRLLVYCAGSPSAASSSASRPRPPAPRRGLPRRLEGAWRSHSGAAILHCVLPLGGGGGPDIQRSGVGEADCQNRGCVGSPRALPPSPRSPRKKKLSSGASRRGRCRRSGLTTHSISGSLYGTIKQNRRVNRDDSTTLV
jgi:hypothetical protein